MMHISVTSHYFSNQDRLAEGLMQVAPFSLHD